MVSDNQDVSSSEIVEVLADERVPGALWTPIVGPETLALMDHLRLSDNGKQRLQEEAVTVLSHCVPPSVAADTTTGLVIGYIQSGKTMSFTTVTALARDNDYRLIILITGINRNLFIQSTDRLQRDLRLNDRRDRKWQFFNNPGSRPDIRQRISTALDWSHALPGIGKQTVLITVLKNSARLNTLNRLLSSIELAGIPTLIIDDEADQASLNTQARTNGQSTIYHRIQQLRQLFPHHTFLQYTATPQAVLLISIMDILSPSFIAVLTPGEAYTGGRVFFEGDFDLIRRIPPSQILGRNQRLPEPPDSMLEGMRIFYLGVAKGLMKVPGDDEDNRAMMIHPAKETLQHGNYTRWVRELQRSWAEVIALPATDPDRRELIEDFAAAYHDLNMTTGDLPQLEKLLPYLETALRTTIITEVNAARGPAPQPDWQQDYSHILVGGEVLNRGYTVEGLTVTYMPRSIGVGNADTIQQRARWFGYKAGYLGLCRVYLSDDMRLAYQAYVAHEEDTRRQLRAFSANGRSLQEWERVLRLSANLHPTRSNVVSHDPLRGNYSNSWYVPRVPYGTSEVNLANQELVRQFLSELEFEPDEGHERRTEEQKHLVASGVSLVSAYTDLLSQLEIVDTKEWERFAGLLKQIEIYLEQNGDEECNIYWMSAGSPRVRSLNSEGVIPTLFQGPNPDRTGEYYPGDRLIRSAKGLTVQIHNLTIRRDGQVPVQNVPTVAVWVPSEMSLSWLAQDQRSNR